MTAAHSAAGFLTISTSMLALGWLSQALAALRGMPTLPDLTRTPSPFQDLSSSDGPDLTVVVPACNEEESIEATLRSLLSSRGVRLQIVAVDDRSTDGTGALMDAVAAEDAGGPHSIEVIHNHELPMGWLGKVNALALGARRATAPWLLFTDGDVAFDPRAAELSLAYAIREKADHVVLILTMEFRSVAEKAVLAVFQSISQWSIRLWRVADPKARDCFGAGGFNLVRREVYERLGGFETLRMAVIEDLSLAREIKRAGYAQRIVTGPGLARIRWIQGALGIVDLLEKNGFAALRYNVGLALAVCFGLVLDIVLPFAAIAHGGWAAAAGVVMCGSIGLSYIASRRVTQVSPWLAALFAPAAAIVLFALVRSMVLTLLRDGVEWRGTLYPLKELRRNLGGW